MVFPKYTVKSALGALVATLPWGGRRAILDRLIQDVGCFQLLTELGERLHVEGITVCGENGTFLGPLHDPDLFGRYATEGSWSMATVRMFQSFFGQQGGTYLDIGANIGLTLVPIASRRNVQCHGFEPAPRNFMYLSHNVKDTCPYGNVVLHQVALFDRQGEASMELSAFNCGDNQLRRNGDARASGEVITVATERLDSVIDVADMRFPLAVKIDTQGAEPGIFAGGNRVLSAASLMSLEFWPFGMHQIGTEPENELVFLENTFREGTAVSGDTSEGADWRPIKEIVQRLREHWNDPMVGKRYLDVVVRK
jgi:FkbM family methyltransferase